MYLRWPSIAWRFNVGLLVLVLKLLRAPLLATNFCTCDDFRTTFCIFAFFAGLMALIYRLPASILVNFCPDLDLQFYLRPVLPSDIVIACICVCVSVCLSLCVNHLLVHAITQDPFKLGSPNLDQRCETPWLRPKLFCRVINLDLQGQI